MAHRGPSGRLPDSAGWAVLELAEGKAEPVAACNTIGEAVDAMVTRVLAENGPVNAAVSYAGSMTEPAADALALALARLTQVGEVERYRVRPAVGAHTGPVQLGRIRVAGVRVTTAVRSWACSMKIVAGPGVRDPIDMRGGAVYVWPHTTRCCRAPTITLEADTTPPDRGFELVHSADGFRLYAVPGFIEPDELELELGRRGKISAYWNGQAWVG